MTRAIGLQVEHVNVLFVFVYILVSSTRHWLIIPKQIGITFGVGMQNTAEFFKNCCLGIT